MSVRVLGAPGIWPVGTKAALDSLAPRGATVRTPRSSHGQQAHAETSPGRWAVCWCPQERGLPGEHPCSGRGHSRTQAAATRVAVHVLPRVCGQRWWKGPTVHWDVTCRPSGPGSSLGSRGAPETRAHDEPVTSSQTQPRGAASADPHGVTVPLRPGECPHTPRCSTAERCTPCGPHSAARQPAAAAVQRGQGPLFYV